jgi:hypothetical protein
MNIKELLRKKIAPIHLLPGDAVELAYTSPEGEVTKVAYVKVDETYVFTEALVFEAEPGELGAGRALGGVFVEDAP